MEGGPFSSERMLHKDYDRKGSVEKKISGYDPQGACRQLASNRQSFVYTYMSSREQ
jgi:hypothetical protein